MQVGFNKFEEEALVCRRETDRDSTGGGGGGTGIALFDVLAARVSPCTSFDGDSRVVESSVEELDRETIDEEARERVLFNALMPA